MRILIILILITLNTAESADWEHYGANLAGQRFVQNSQITKHNIAELSQAWVFRTGDTTNGQNFFGRPSNFKATPILADDLLVFSSGMNRVFAVKAVSGELQWSYDPQVDFSRPYSEMFTSRGVSLWRSGQSGSCETRVILGTLDARLIAIDLTTGQVCTEFGTRGVVKLSRGVKGYRKWEYSLTSPVTVVNNVIVVGSSVGDNGSVATDSGVVRGFDARSGRKLWDWHPIQDRKTQTGAANVWSVMAADKDLNLVYLPTTSPSPDFFGGKRAGNNKHANSLVALDITTGELQWAFQTVHHDLWDYDNAAQPFLFDGNFENGQKAAIALATKMGHVFVLDRKTGAPLLPVKETPVPKSLIPEEDAATTQPIPVKPPPLHPDAPKDLELWWTSQEHKQACEEQLKDVAYSGIFTPPSLKGTLLYPGNAGGTNWGSLAGSPDGEVSVLVQNRLPTRVRLIPRKDFSKESETQPLKNVDIQYTAQSGTPYGMARFDVYDRQTGLPCFRGPWSELIALNLNTGAILWRSPLGRFAGAEHHPDAKNWGGFNSGGPLMTDTGLVFVTARFGSTLEAFEARSGKKIWSSPLPARPHATPMSFIRNGQQFVVITAGGPEAGTDKRGDYVLAYALGPATDPQ